MEEVLPFEYGYLYKIINTPNQDELRSSFQLDIDMNSVWFNSYGGHYGNVYNNGIQNHKYFHPIGYIPSNLKVILEVVIEEKEETSGHLTLSGMNFSTSTIEKKYKKITRAEVDINVFIRNFEKVL